MLLFASFAAFLRSAELLVPIDDEDVLIYLETNCQVRLFLERAMDAGDFPNWQMLYTDFCNWCKRDRFFIIHN